MISQYFDSFEVRNSPTAIKVLTITATFPSLIQPWLINHLVQIEKLGGDNRIISQREQKQLFSEAITDYHLLDKYRCIPTNRWRLLASSIEAVIDPRIRGQTRILLKKYLTGDHRLRAKILDCLAAPTFSVRPDIIHSHSEPVGAKFLNLIKANGAPLAVTFHGLRPVGVPQVSEKARQEYVAAAEIIFVNTEFAKNQYENLGAPSNKMAIVPQGIDLNAWPFMPREFPVDGCINLLTVGRLHPDKGHKFALEAVNLLVKHGINVHYTIVGSGPEKARILNLAESLQISENVDLRSSISDEELRSIYRESHLFILPSLRDQDGYHEETQGVVLQEAQASGLITVATKTGGIPEVIDDDRSGFLVPDRDAEALAGKLLEIIRRKDDWISIQEKARDWVELHFSADKIGLKMNAYYRDICR